MLVSDSNQENRFGKKRGSLDLPNVMCSNSFDLSNSSGSSKGNFFQVSLKIKLILSIAMFEEKVIQEFSVS